MAEPQELTDAEEIMLLFAAEIKRRLKDEATELKAADFEMIRKLLQDNNTTLASVRRGNFGDFAQKVAESFPFTGDEDPPVFTN